MELKFVRRRGERGLTLTELLVALAVLTIVAGAIAGAFAIGIRVLGSGGAQARLMGSHDLLAFEQQIGADIARADCLKAPNETTVPSGGCASSVQKNPSSCGTGSYALCLAWYVPASATCHTVLYWQKANGTVVRSDIASGGGPATSDQVTTGPLNVTATWSAAATTNNGYLWTNQVSVKVTQVGTSGAPTVGPLTSTLLAVPLAVDPLSPALASGSQSC